MLESQFFHLLPNPLILCYSIISISTLCCCRMMPLMSRHNALRPTPIYPPTCDGFVLVSPGSNKSHRGTVPTENMQAFFSGGRPNRSNSFQGWIGFEKKAYYAIPLLDRTNDHQYSSHTLSSINLSYMILMYHNPHASVSNESSTVVTFDPVVRLRPIPYPPHYQYYQRHSHTSGMGNKVSCQAGSYSNGPYSIFRKRRML